MANETENSDKLRTKLLIENKKLWVAAAPAIFTRFSMYGINVISQAFMGKIGSTQLAAFALVFTLLTRFANGLLVILYSLVPAKDTLFFFCTGFKERMLSLKRDYGSII